MAQIHKVEGSLVIKAPVAEMHDIWSTKLSLMHALCPDIIHSVDSLQGQLGSQGCVVAWKFNHQGKLEVSKLMMEVVDKENNRIVFKGIEGGPLKLYKSFRAIYEASPTDNVVRWTFEYEKGSDDDPEPSSYLDLMMALMKHIDANLPSLALA